MPTDLAVQRNGQRKVQQDIVVDGKAKHDSQEAVVSQALLTISIW